VQLRTEGARYDVLNAVFGAKGLDQDDDLVALLARTDAVTALLASHGGADLLGAYRRAANILRIEDKKDGPHDGSPSPGTEAAEMALFDALQAMQDVTDLLRREDYAAAMAMTARLRAPLDAFFDKVTVNAPEPELRRNRLRLLNQVRAIMDQIADFSRIEG
jgi:glycyl-tRNA synthetase beta chain